MNSRHNAAWGEDLNHSRTNTICKVFVRSSVNFYIPFPEQENGGAPKLTKACVYVCVCVAFLETWAVWCYIKPISRSYSSFLHHFTSFIVQSLVPYVCTFFTFSLLLHCTSLSFIKLISHSHLPVIPFILFGFILSMSTYGRILHTPSCNWTSVKSLQKLDYKSTL